LFVALVLVRLAEAHDFLQHLHVKVLALDSKKTTFGQLVTV
jgi:hypothetical protein